MEEYISGNTNDPKISIIVGFTEDYRHLLDRAINEVINENGEIEYIGIRHEEIDGRWNECKCKNHGATKANGDILVFSNADILIPKELLDYSEKVIEHNRTNYVMALRVDDLAPHVPFKHVLFCGPVVLPFACGDFVACHRSLFMTSGGFNEEMEGWGYLDRDFVGKLSLTGGKFVLAPHFVYHQSHPRNESVSDENTNIEIGKKCGTFEGPFKVKSAYFMK